ncbi:MAG: FAD-dependent oxidoreductase [Candidatus Binataceae bacterium]|jgi:ferredoxin-NADP reductase
MAIDSNTGSSRQRSSYTARVERIFDHAEDTRSLFLRTIGTPMPRFIPGMFISVAIPLESETRARPYSIATTPEEGEPFELCFNLVPGGAGSAWMFDRQVGGEINFIGPFGAFTLDRAPEAEAIFIAEGTGIAAIRPMLKRLAATPLVHPITLLYAADRGDHLLYRAELEELAAADARFRLQTHTAQGSDAVYERLLCETRRQWVDADDDRSRHFYICGVGSGVIALRDLLRGSGYERRAVKYEQW